MPLEQYPRPRLGAGASRGEAESGDDPAINLNAILKVGEENWR